MSQWLLWHFWKLKSWIKQGPIPLRIWTGGEQSRTIDKDPGIRQNITAYNESKQKGRQHEPPGMRKSREEDSFG